jgi:uncharacterized protein YbbC (DUF1343 family)
MMLTGLDTLLDQPESLAGRRYAVASHSAAVSLDLLPIHLALLRSGAPRPVRLFGPEHGFYGIEQDMVPTQGGRDPWTGVPILSLYGEEEGSLRPDRSAFEDLDLVLVDFQDVGSRYYTYAATAVWTVEAALESGCEVWLLDRPNPLGGEVIEGNVRRPGFESFVGAFEIPVRHGLTLAELVLFALGDRREKGALKILPLRDWSRRMQWRETRRRWIPPSPNIPTPRIARLYPGACLVEATTVSEGRGTTRPFELIGSPAVDPLRLADRLNGSNLAGVRFVPTYFRPLYQKHSGNLCGGTQWMVMDGATMKPYRCGVEILRALFDLADDFGWREDAYEFETDRPAIDLLTGDDTFRKSLASGSGVEEWLAGWGAEEAAFREKRRPYLLYPQ